MTALHDLTGEQLRRRIAERLGYAVIPWKGAYTIAYQGIPNDLYLGSGPDDAWGLACEGLYPLIPDWPTDEGAALTACMDVARERDMMLRMYPALNADGDAMIAAELYEDEERGEEYAACTPTLARALAELLAAALEVQP